MVATWFIEKARYGMEGTIEWAGIAPIAILGLIFIIYCVVDIARHDVKHLPKWAWALICLLSIPLGGIVYLLVGRDSNR